MATITPIPSTTAIKDSRSIINTNFSNVATELNNLVAANGITGATGATGATGPIGLGINYRGNWANNVSYATLDAVKYGIYVWVAKATNISTTPGTDATKWETFLDFGAATGSGVMKSGTYASLPTASSNPNTVYKATDGPLLHQSNGTTWASFGPMIQNTPLDDTGWSFVNQGGATVTTLGTTRILNVPGNAGDAVRMYMRNVPPVAPYTITWSGFVDLYPSNYVGGGVCLYNSGNGRIVMFSVGYGNGMSFSVSLWNSVTSFSSTPFSFLFPLQFERYFLRIVDDGTNFNFYQSLHGYSYDILMGTYARASWLGAPTQIGIFGDSNNSKPMSVTTLHWSVT